MGYGDREPSAYRHAPSGRQYAKGDAPNKRLVDTFLILKEEEKFRDAIRRSISPQVLF
jgi:hypothetical protein